MEDLHTRPSDVRLEAAAAVRRLVDAMSGHVGDDAQLADVAAQAAALAERLESNERRVRPRDQYLRYTEPVAEGGELSCWPDCAVAGSAHPSSTDLVGRRDGDDAVVKATLGPSHEGLPGIAHGGVVASLFDEAMGFAAWMDVVPTVTAWLRIDYRAPVPTGEQIEVRARVRGREGRKLMIEAEATAHGQVAATAEGLFVVPREFAQT